MKVLFDQGTPAPLRNHLTDHLVSTAYEQGWARFKNGELLQESEAGGFEVLVTTDQNLKYQQNLSSRSIAIVVLTSTSWPRLQEILPEVIAAVGNSEPNGYSEVVIPLGRKPS